MSEVDTRAMDSAPAPPQLEDSDDPLLLITRGHLYSTRNDLGRAERCFRRALALNPNLPMAHNNLGWVRQMQGDTDGAITSYRQALDLNPSLDLARRNLATLLSDLECFEEAIPLWGALLAARPNDWRLLEEMIGSALRAGQMTCAADYAERYATLKRGSKWHSLPGGRVRPPETPIPAPLLTVPKLRHDIEQFCYLQHHGLLGGEFTTIIHNYERVLADAVPRGETARVPLDEIERELIGDVYGRIVHLRTTPRVQGRALSHRWESASMEEEYIRHPLGIVVVDDFLSEEALDGVRQFCLQSTVWFTNRYAHGRLGAFFREGFTCPLLIQIADELRRAFPRVIGDRNRLFQLWAFKYNHIQPATLAHADFAAINVNFWITPDSANLEKNSGGLVIYHMEAPRDWTFDSYNKEGKKIDVLLAEKKAQSTTIPYRANRAIIFHSDLFHTTAPIQFREGYENRRINVTMLYGRRENAVPPRS